MVVCNYVLYLYQQKQTKTKIMNLLNNKLGIKEGQKITFRLYNTVYTRKVQSVYVQSFNGLTSYNVNRIGSGTGYTSVDAEDIIEVK